MLGLASNLLKVSIYWTTVGVGVGSGVLGPTIPVALFGRLDRVLFLSTCCVFFSSFVEYFVEYFVVYVLNIWSFVVLSIRILPCLSTLWVFPSTSEFILRTVRLLFEYCSITD